MNGRCYIPLSRQTEETITAEGGCPDSCPGLESVATRVVVNEDKVVARVVPQLAGVAARFFGA
jgi:hypothetical protein